MAALTRSRPAAPHAGAQRAAARSARRAADVDIDDGAGVVSHARGARPPGDGTRGRCARRGGDRDHAHARRCADGVAHGAAAARTHGHARGTIATCAGPRGTAVRAVPRAARYVVAYRAGECGDGGGGRDHGGEWRTGGITRLGVARSGRGDGGDGAVARGVWAGRGGAGSGAGHTPAGAGGGVGGGDAGG